MPGLPRSVGFGPVFFPAETGFVHAPVGGLPGPVDVAEFLAFFQERGPDEPENALSSPGLEPVMGTAVVAKFFREMVPLTPGA